jgi:predicted aspartyl protease
MKQDGGGTMLTRYLVLAAALASSAGLSAQTAMTTLDAVSGVPDIDKTTQTEDVRFHNDGEDRMTVPVHLSGAGPYQFLVDTGADRSAVSRQIVTSLKLPSAGGAELHSLSGVSTIGTARLTNVALTRTPERSVDAAVLDGAYIGADGIVGVDLLRSQRVQFDFEKQTMSIVPSEVPDFVKEPGTIVVRAKRKNGRLVVTDATANGERLTVVLDTGSQVSIGNEALRRRLNREDLVSIEKRVELESVTGQKITGDYMFVRELSIGGVSLSNLAIVFADAHTFKQLKLDRTPALLLGMNAIRAFKRVSIDFANRKFRVVLPEHSELDTQVASARLR